MDPARYNYFKNLSDLELSRQYRDYSKKSSLRPLALDNARDVIAIARVLKDRGSSVEQLLAEYPEPVVDDSAPTGLRLQDIPSRFRSKKISSKKGAPKP